MGKAPDMPKPVKQAAPITPESDDVQAAGQREIESLRRKKGRASQFFTNPAIKTGFSGGYGIKTGSV